MVTAVGGDPGSEPVDVLSLAGGTRVALRQIQPDDAERLRRLFYRLSPETVYWRFFTPVHVPREEVLEHFARVDHQRREAIVADIEGEVVGVARYDQAEGTSEADTAVLVEDAWQGQGLAKVLLRRLTWVAHQRGIRTFTALIMGENVRARHLYSMVFAAVDAHLDGSEWHLRISLEGPGAGCR
ncbi:MAG TPA: GNAT family N-acetyltransferase [Acidimicrobiales bacterium]|jgi:RimJ/RimL family protein N-acetyltransferase|nr:GNAT family N-acetyltransferase [Acidimicrobiales bacterium]